MISQEKNTYDVIVVGAGISGINSAYRVQTQVPDYSYTILEAKGEIGGTWALFKYPGIRSDSDLHTFGFAWRPWQEHRAIADGASIVKYVRDCAEKEGIDQHIQFHHKLVHADWSSDQQMWTLTVEHDGQQKYFHARFVMLGTGYYDYDQPLEAKIPGLKNFQGEIVHPQFWPENLQYDNKKIVVIGSGATAITLIPNLADRAEKVTMLQRSSSYILALPNPTDSWSHRILPSWLAYRLDRLRFLILPFLLFKFCRAFPNAGRKMMRAATSKQLPANIPHDPHFKPVYNPWDQRLCLCPDGDFFKALRDGKCDVATGHIKTVTEHGITLESGQEIDADIIVTATGLKITLAGGATISADGKEINSSEKYLWKYLMLEDVPNLCIIIGYTNASWTLGADASAQLMTRLMNNTKKAGQTSATPRRPSEGMKSLPMMNLNSTYLVSAQGRMPKTGDKHQWVARDNYFKDIYEAKWGDIKTDLELKKVST